MEIQKTTEEIERRLRVLSADRKNFGLTSTQEVEVIKLKRILKDFEENAKYKGGIGRRD